jgi:hypothetical protein
MKMDVIHCCETVQIWAIQLYIPQDGDILNYWSDFLHYQRQDRRLFQIHGRQYTDFINIHTYQLSTKVQNCCDKKFTHSRHAQQDVKHMNDDNSKNGVTI